MWISTSMKQIKPRFPLDRDRGVQFKRVMRMMFMMSDRWYSTGELANEFGVTKKTIRRSLMFIEDVGVPLIEQIDPISDAPEGSKSAFTRRFMIETRWMKRFL